MTNPGSRRTTTEKTPHPTRRDAPPWHPEDVRFDPSPVTYLFRLPLARSRCPQLAAAHIGAGFGPFDPLARKAKAMKSRTERSRARGWSRRGWRWRHRLRSRRISPHGVRHTILKRRLMRRQRATYEPRGRPLRSARGQQASRSHSP
jgi:hypothetical protein